MNRITIYHLLLLIYFIIYLFKINSKHINKIKIISILQFRQYTTI